MYKFIFTVISLYFTIISNGQSLKPKSVNNNPLIDTCHIWSILKYDESFSPDHLNPTLKTTWLKVKGDTILNSLKYQILWSSADENRANWAIDNFIREDDGKVYRSRVSKYVNQTCQTFNGR